jgi:hypothetical protein
MLEAYDELEDRRVEISNFDPETTTEAVVLETAVEYGAVEKVDMSEKASGKIFVKYYDLRHSYALRGATIRFGRLTWQLQFAHPEKIGNVKKPPNNGTIVVFKAPAEVTHDVLLAEFEKHGDIRDIRSSQGQRFVEFWDTRACEKALLFARGTKLFGLKLSVEYSRPGGYRKNPDAFLSSRKPVVARAAKGKAPASIKQVPGIQIQITKPVENAVPAIQIEKKHDRCPVTLRHANPVTA